MASARKARAALESMDGVLKVFADERTNEVSVFYEEDDVSTGKLEKRLNQEGFFVEQITE